jgi:hypothetical protein
MLTLPRRQKRGREVRAPQANAGKCRTIRAVEPDVPIRAEEPMLPARDRRVGWNPNTFHDRRDCARAGFHPRRERPNMGLGAASLSLMGGMSRLGRWR